MADVIQAFEHYLHDALGIKVKLKPWKEEAKLPFFLKDAYSFHEADLLSITCVVAIARNDDTTTPGSISKQFQQLKQKLPGLYIYVCPSISSYNRRRLIEQHIPFVIPGNQMYLPELAIDLRERFLKPRSKKKTLSPATQAIVIYALNHPESKQFSSTELGSALQYTSMTISRALHELEATGIGQVTKVRRECQLRFPNDKQQLWKDTEPFMRSPVKKQVWLKKNKWLENQIKKSGVIAGLTALSHHTMLHPPLIPSYAIDNETWKTWIHSGTLQELPSAEDADLEIEIWKYNPLLFAKEGVVDSFSLSLSLEEVPDDRVNIALIKMMESSNGKGTKSI